VARERQRESASTQPPSERSQMEDSPQRSRRISGCLLRQRGIESADII